MRKIAFFAALAFAGVGFDLLGAEAIELSDIGVADASAEIVLGEWHGGFDKCLEKANKEHIPMFAMWSNTGCGHCENVYTAIVTERFVNWRRGQGSNIGKIILLLMKGGVDGNGYSTSSAGYDWAWGPGHTLGLYPFTVLYWNKEDGSVIRMHQTGEQLTSNYTYAMGAENLIERIEEAFAGWTGVSESPAAGATFAVGTSENSRLEAEVGQTTYVDLPLVRTNGVTVAGTNYLTIAANGKTLSADVPVVWPDGAGDIMHRVNLSSLGYSGKAGDVLNLTLADDTQTNFVATTTITYVAPVENSPKNPLWFGERTADSLQ